MSTNASIAVEHKDNTVSVVYLHYDGSVNWAGKTLVRHYNTLEKAEQLVALGDISVLGERIEPIGEHSFAKRESGTNVYYNRDRGENTVIDHYDSIQDYMRNNIQEEYNYIFTEGDDKAGNRVEGWFVEVCSDNVLGEFVLVSEVL